jgi:hypothetical protein
VRVGIAWVVLASAGVASAGCGRRATTADCQLIVDKSVELQMKEMSFTSDAEVQKRVEQVRSQLQGDIASCEGRRITDRTVACVQAATTTKEMDQCLR